MIVADVPEKLAHYCVVARRIMLEFMTVNSCIAATKVTCGCLTHLGFTVEPVATKWVLELPSLLLAYTSGLSAEELKNNKRARTEWEGWNGHLVSIVNRRWLIDASFDQADVALGGVLRIDKMCYLFPLPSVLSDLSFHADMRVVVNSLDARIQYVTTDDMAWKSSPAWNDEYLPFLEQTILHRMGVA